MFNCVWKIVHISKTTESKIVQKRPRVDRLPILTACDVRASQRKEGERKTRNSKWDYRVFIERSERQEDSLQLWRSGCASRCLGPSVWRGTTADVGRRTRGTNWKWKQSHLFSSGFSIIFTIYYFRWVIRRRDDSLTRLSESQNKPHTHATCPRSQSHFTSFTARFSRISINDKSIDHF